jgi:hypothetical protein
VQWLDADSNRQPACKFRLHITGSRCRPSATSLSLLNVHHS